MERFDLPLPEILPGWVWLTGAGPGDPGLLTLHALNGIQNADVIVYDALVSDPILDLAPPDCERISAGKRGGRPSPSQPDISARLVALARRGRRVLRLKGGDPLVFGRGGEEAMALVAAGIPFRIIPGISAGLGGLAYAGVPLTHRETNPVVSFVAGHTASGDLSRSVDWRALASASPVIVFYMALRSLPDIRRHLLDAGRRADEAVAIISNATTPEQLVMDTTLERCVSDLARTEISPPALVVVGEVVRLRAALDWLGAMGGRKLDSDPLNRGLPRAAG